MVTEADLRINPTVYEWTGRAISLLEKVLRVRIHLHHDAGQLRSGDIFLFNHFARFETFIPQYLIFRETGALSRSVASAEFFEEDDAFARYLLSIGAVPNDYPGLLPFLAAEVLRGRKLIVFPEGGMVKDRRVLDPSGRYSVYSRTSKERRKHHTGAAVVAQALDGFKAAVREAAAAGDLARLDRWAEELGLDGHAALLAAARKPTVIVPSNITFYPIRITSNLLERAARVFHRGLSPRLAEELLIEGNILLAETDMDIRLGDPVRPVDFCSGWERWLTRRVARSVEGLGEFFSPRSEGERWSERLWRRRARRNVLRIRDAYMVEMYAGVTVNLSHLASRLVYRLLDRGAEGVEARVFHRALYLSVKLLQQAGRVHLHESVRNPERYAGLLRGRCEGLEQLVETARASDLLAREDGRYRFLPELCREFGFDEIRIENPIAVYANEVQPIAAVTRAVERGLARAPELEEVELARLRFDDEVRSYHWDRQAFRQPRHEEINREETATRSGEPFLSLPRKGARELGVLLVHGFTASPAEMRPLARRLEGVGYPVLGVRLKGHGTSPWDLLERSWTDWLESVRTGYEILAAFAPRLALVGFSAGGGLALRLAAEAPPGLAGVVAAAAPIKVRDKSLSLVPLVHGANVMLDTVSTIKGIMLFHRSHPEHPEINYQRMPIRALYELGRMIDDVEGHLPAVRCPVLLVQGDEDPTVDPRSADILFEKLGTPRERKRLVRIASRRHGVLYENTGGIHDRVLAFLGELEAEEGREGESRQGVAN